MRTRRKITLIKSMKLILEEARLTLETHSNNKNKFNSKHLKLDSIRVWDSKLLILTQIRSLKLTTLLARQLEVIII